LEPPQLLNFVLTYVNKLYENYKNKIISLIFFIHIYLLILLWDRSKNEIDLVFDNVKT
jgi:hypothetical protein